MLTLSTIAGATAVLSTVAHAQTTAFSYQGKLTDGGAPATGSYDLQFRLFDTSAVGTGVQQGTAMVLPAVAVDAGIFTVALDFGANVPSLTVCSWALACCENPIPARIVRALRS